MYKLNKKNKMIIICVVVLLISIIGYYIYAKTDDSEIVIESENIATNNKTEEKIKEEKKHKIIIHVDGCVKKPGIIELTENSRVAQAIEKAGGFTKEADTLEVNLASILEDGMKIYIPSHNDNKGEMKMETDTKSKININSANQTELEKLPGIGSSTALKIINYRKENGKFNTIEDLKNIKGIGDSKFQKIKELIYVR